MNSQNGYYLDLSEFVGNGPFKDIYDELFGRDRKESSAKNPFTVTSTLSSFRFAKVSDSGTHSYKLSLPGAKREEFKIVYDVRTKCLNVQGKYKEGGDFKYDIYFVSDINSEEIVAKYEDGILYISAKDKIGSKVIVDVT